MALAIKKSSFYLIAALLSLACAVYLDPEENFILEWTVNNSTKPPTRRFSFKRLLEPEVRPDTIN